MRVMSATSYPDHFEKTGWAVDHDSGLTKRAYELARATRSPCNCAYCLNYRAARDNARPQALSDILDGFGINQDMETEVSEFGRTPSGKHLYSGWYSLVGEVRCDPSDRMLVVPGDLPGTVEWLVFFTPGRALAFDTFGDAALVRLEFQVELPWVLDECPKET